MIMFMLKKMTSFFQIFFFFIDVCFQRTVRYHLLGIATLGNHSLKSSSWHQALILSLPGICETVFTCFKLKIQNTIIFSTPLSEDLSNILAGAHSFTLSNKITKKKKGKYSLLQFLTSPVAICNRFHPSHTLKMPISISVLVFPWMLHWVRIRIL